MAELTARQSLGRYSLRIKGRSFSAFQPSDLMFLTDQWSRGRNLGILGCARATGTSPDQLQFCNHILFLILYARLNMKQLNSNLHITDPFPITDTLFKLDWFPNPILQTKQLKNLPLPSDTTHIPHIWQLRGSVQAPFCTASKRLSWDRPRMKL